MDSVVRALAGAARILPAITPTNAVEERGRIVSLLERGRVPVPRWELPALVRRPEAPRLLSEARSLAKSSPAASLYLAKLDELELDLALLDALGDPARVRPLAKQRFGSGKQRIATDGGPITLARAAKTILATVAPADAEPRTLPADDRRGPSAAAIIRQTAWRAGLDIEVRVDARLAASAAAGERVVCLARRRFGVLEAWRLAVHEVLGHLTAGANGRTQPLGVLALGTARSFGDQEGLAIALEERAGVLDGTRLRTLAARVVATDAMHAGRPFGEVARALVEEDGFTVPAAVAIAERAYRAGGVARDAAYLRGFLRVRRALARGETNVDELRNGKIGLDDLPTLRALATDGLVRPPTYRFSFSASLVATDGGSRRETSPPSTAASLTRFELT